TGARKVHSLIDKVYQRKNLEMAWETVQAHRGSGGVDGQSLEGFAAQLDQQLDRLQSELKEDVYRPQPVRQVQITDTLILDEDGVYDPAHFNDRLLLGLKGTMSEAELHVLGAVLQGGILNKPRRGELMMRPPIGYAYDANARMVFDPDQQIQQAVRLVFETFRRTGSALGTVRAFRQEGLLF